MKVSRRGVLGGVVAASAGLARSASSQDQVQPSAELTPDDQRLVERAAAYLQGLTTAEARFVQTDPRGAEANGTVYLQRPGRARFDYDPPSGLQIASDGHEVTVVDHRLKTIRAYPLGLTPLSLFLARDIRLDRSVKVVQVVRDSSGFTVVAREAHGKSRGSIALNFADAPLALVGWTVTDSRGAAVKVRLQPLVHDRPHPADFFVLADPATKANPAETR